MTSKIAAGRGCPICAIAAGRAAAHYWRELDRERGYPDRVRQGADRGRLPRALIPEEYGGAACRSRPRGDPGGDPARAATAPPATRRCTSWARCCGTAARSRSEVPARRSPTGELRLQAFGVTEPTSGTDTTRCAPPRGARATLRRQRPEDLDLARRAFRPDAAARAHHAARPGGEATEGCRPSSSTCARRWARA
jgi:alkylation response protein AidB-like acyl-CoA dehydrogenase